MPFIAPALLSILIAQHACNWVYQSSVRGYFIQTYGNHGAERLSLYFSWLNPTFLAIASLSYIALLIARRTRPRIDAFCVWRAGSLGIATVCLGIFSIALTIGVVRGLIPYERSTFIGVTLALSFKLLAIFVVWKAFKANRVSSDTENVYKPSWKLLVVLATSIHLILPVRHYMISLATQVMPTPLIEGIPSWLWPHNLSLQSFVIDSLAALLLARILLICGTKEGVFAPFGESRTVSVAFWFTVAFLVLTPLAVMLNAIPYGGGGIPNGFKSLLALTEAIGTYLLYRGLVRSAA